MIAFTDAEKQTIARLSVAGGWDTGDAVDLKRKIKDHFLGKGVPCCCYCRLSMSAWHRITIDTEHVLPKQRFPRYTFDVRNLNISCKRCNMGIKGADVSFYLGLPNEADPFKSELYSFIHPNLDDASEHLQVVVLQLDNGLLINYFPKTPKGHATLEYFRLKEIATNSFSKPQGLEITLPSVTLPPEIFRALSELVKHPQ